MDADFAARLINHLRTTLAVSDLEYAEPPVPITGGFDTLIYSFRLSAVPDELSKPLILRVFREGNPWVTLSGPERARFETTVQNTVAGLGYPAPLVHQVCDDAAVIGSPFLIMEHLPGRIMLDLIFRPSRFWFRLPGILAEAHLRLHAFDPDVLLAAIGKAGVPARVLSVADWLAQVQRLIAQAALDGLTPGMQWLLDHRPPKPERSAICHGDFHPLNILLDRGKVTGVIDWPWVRIACPEYDVGATIAIFTQGPVDLPGFLQPIVNLGRRLLISRYLGAYRRLRPLDPDALRYYEALRLLGFLVEAGHHRQGEAGIIPVPEKPTAFGASLTVKSIVTRFHELTRVEVAVPPHAVKVR